jgi:hypothetical protein
MLLSAEGSERPRPRVLHRHAGLRAFINSMDTYMPLTPSAEGTDIIEPVLVVACDSASASFYWCDTILHPSAPPSENALTPPLPLAAPPRGLRWGR